MGLFSDIYNSVAKFFRPQEEQGEASKSTATNRLKLVLMQDRANVSADFLEMMKQEIIDVIKKYIEVEENEIDVRLTNEVKEDGTTGAPSLYANIPIVNIRNDMKKEVQEEKKEEAKKQEKSEEPKEVKEEIKVEEKEEIIEETSKEDEQEEVVEVVEVKEEAKKD